MSTNTLPQNQGCAVCEHLAADTVDRDARIADLAADLEAYRFLAREALHALHELTTSHDRLRQQQHRLIEECRRLREQIRRDEQRAAA